MKQLFHNSSAHIPLFLFQETTTPIETNCDSTEAEVSLAESVQAALTKVQLEIEATPLDDNEITQKDMLLRQMRGDITFQPINETKGAITSYGRSEVVNIISIGGQKAIQLDGVPSIRFIITKANPQQAYKNMGRLINLMNYAIRNKVKLAGYFEDVHMFEKYTDMFPLREIDFRQLSHYVERKMGLKGNKK